MVNTKLLYTLGFRFNEALNIYIYGNYSVYVYPDYKGYPIITNGSVGHLSYNDETLIRLVDECK